MAQNPPRLLRIPCPICKVLAYITSSEPTIRQERFARIADAPIHVEVYCPSCMNESETDCCRFQIF
jgi:phage FluMu protein Com